jgi:Uma2 family endonuclease
VNARVFIPVDKAAFYRFIATEPEGRYEFEQGRIVQQMTGGTQKHSRIAQRFLLALLAQIDGMRWLALTDWGVETAKTIRYGDVVVYPAGEPVSNLSTSQPAIIVEVLSPSSLARDMDVKPAEYLAMASLQAYVVASQTDAACLAWIRGAGGMFPDEPAEFAAGEVIAVPSLDVAIPLAAIYAGIDLTPEDPTAHG